jgi:hypothetical protein
MDDIAKSNGREPKVVWAEFLTLSWKVWVHPTTSTYLFIQPIQPLCPGFVLITKVCPYTGILSHGAGMSKIAIR